ncbi:MAG: hypothetical protein PHI98_06355 [Eubacteriales bacterium]|nr:hypothetical protein [Eubacteriales bacterium]
MTDLELAKRYAPIIHFDRNETIPFQAFGYTVLRRTGESPSFRRILTVPQDAECVIEYACYWDYDIQHMYDLEHIWVTVGKDGQPVAAEGSFHGKYLTLLVPELPGALPPTKGHIHAFCQPGKHAFLADGSFTRLIPGWRECCNVAAGGEVLVGGPFAGVYQPTEEDNQRCKRYIKENYAFEPTLNFSKPMPETVKYMTWPEMFEWIPRRIRQECDRLSKRQ